jgi:biopolymer transport protein ExbD
MPSVKLPKKSTDTDMTPFVDVAFLILAFFMLATKFKPPEPVPIKTPGSVITQKLPANNAVMITVDSTNRVFFTVLSEKDPSVYTSMIQSLNASKGLNLTPEEMANFKKTYMIGVPFSGLKSLLSTSTDDQKNLKQPGIPVMDSATNEMVWWISEAKKAFAGQKLQFLIKGDGQSKYPAFEAIVNALKRNEEFKYNLVTSLEDIPPNSELDKVNRKVKKTN